LHAPDFLGFADGFAMAREHPGFVERGFRLQAVGRRILEVIGGRAVHPVNVAVGGFHRSPSAAAIRGLLPDLEWGLAAAGDLVREVSRFEMPPFHQVAECVAVRADGEYPVDEGRIVSSGGASGTPLDIAAEEYPLHFEERQVPWSTALHSLRLPAGTPYLTGPQARINLCGGDLPPAARRTAECCGLELPVHNSFQSIVARSLELLAACEEAAAIARSATADVVPCRVDVTPRAGVGCHATEAPRGMLYHRYEIDADGLVSRATIIPPTAQNQAQLEADLRAFIPTRDGRDDAEVTRWCERLIRNYDPCISCATHFLQVSIARESGPAGGPS
ncbi:MAG: nickel-dependent hydrogenase large subunit, partial [Planctomycetia bacterium]